MDFISEKLPVEPSQEVIAWAKEKLLSDTHALVYRSGWYVDPLTESKETCVDARCSVCRGIAKLPKVQGSGCSRGCSSAPFGFLDASGSAVIHGGNTLCPICQRPVKAVYNSRVNDEYILGECLVLDIQNILGHLVLLYWRIQRRIDDQAFESIWTAPKVAYVVGHRKIEAYEKSNNWYKRYQYKDLVGCKGDVFPWKKTLLDNTFAENCKLDLYLKCRGDKFPVSYLRLWVQRPSVENLLVQGAGNILNEMIKRDCNASAYYSSEVVIPKLSDMNWKDKRPAQMLGISKDLLRFAVSQKWHLDELEVLRCLAKREVLKPEDDVPLVRKCGVSNLKHLLTHQLDGSVMQSVRYLVKQKKCDAVTLTDYWRLVQLNGGDCQDRSIRFPQDLHRAHDTESEKQRFERQKGYPKQFSDRNAILQEYSFESDGLLIRPASSAEELYQEGKKLHHCVYSYLDRHVKGETAIFLIRSTDAPDVPFFTLELDEIRMVVRQNRGLRNCSRTSEVQAFEEKWLAWLKGQRIGKGKIA